MQYWSMIDERAQDEYHHLKDSEEQSSSLNPRPLEEGDRRVSLDFLNEDEMKPPEQGEVPVK